MIRGVLVEGDVDFCSLKVTQDWSKLVPVCSQFVGVSLMVVSTPIWVYQLKIARKSEFFTEFSLILAICTLALFELSRIDL